MRNRMAFKQRTRVREGKEVAQVGSNQQDTQQQMRAHGGAGMR